MSREVVFDTETTGLDPNAGHRLVEVGCVELVNHLPTGRVFQAYMNPSRSMPTEAFAVHGLSEEFLANYPPFNACAEGLLEFIGDSQLVIHNAEFDMRFLNFELAQIGLGTVPMSRAVDTLMMARRKFPGSPASLKALCARFGIDDSARDLHGALLDAQLTASVYLELIGGREPALALAAASAKAGLEAIASGAVRPPRPHAPEPEEEKAHQAFLARLKNPVWLA